MVTIRRGRVIKSSPKICQNSSVIEISYHYEYIPLRRSNWPYPKTIPSGFATQEIKEMNKLKNRK